ncbi:MAG: hypothetical protein ACYCSF_08350 [Acidimicrobiales bacterium]
MRSSNLSKAFCDQADAAGVKVVASLPDDWVLPLIQAVEADERFVHVGVAREAEAVGVCAGAFFGGANSLAIMGMAGVLAIVHELATLNLMHDIPLLIVTSMRGQPDEEDHTVYQVVQGQVGARVLQSLGVYHRVIESFEQLDLPKMMKHSRITKKPALVSITRRLALEFAEVG